ncbi:DNA adenine methylase [Budvicia aquatica]|uniref:DNA adenine methylase n=1 Tax=Budvicia aquatica TaxID=82979 RepID=A0A484ZB86_9GAMM|nr:DNA adenine methylase [Budvicia aquatica]
MKKSRSFLKWAGGKYPLVNEIREYLPRGECLIEPFVGAGSVFLNTDYDEYVLADINSDLINLYNIVKQRTDQVVQDSRELFTDEYNQEPVYYQLRTEFNQSRDPYRRALLFLYLNRHCYNGLCRYNLSGEFNVPFGRYKKPYFPETELYCFAEKAKRATFFCENYEQTMMKGRKRSRCFIAILLMHLCQQRLILRLIIPIASTSTISNGWHYWLKMSLKVLVCRY